MDAILRAENLGISFGGVHALADVSVSVRPGEILSIIGPNGAGKTTLFNLISGVYRPHTGRVLLDRKDVTGLAPHRLAARGLTRTFQNLQLFLRMTALENVLSGRHLHENRNPISHLLSLPSVGRARAKARDRSMAILESVGLAAYSGRLAGTMPYGALKRLEIARALALKPTILLLDEPAAGCNVNETEEVDEIIRGIASSGVAIVLVEHDMKLVMKISNHILVLNFGHTIAEGNAANVRSNPAVIQAYLGYGEQGQARAVD
jgi:branched-chain amino acid transport system ATP-binding protein